MLKIINQLMKKLVMNKNVLNVYFNELNIKNINNN